MLSASLSVFIANAGNVVDGMIIGKFLEDGALTAYALTLPVSFLVSTLTGIFAAGMQSMGGGAIGKGNMRLADEYFSSAVFTECFTLILVAAILIIFPARAADILGASKHSPEIFRQTCGYISGFAPGIPFLGASVMLVSIMYTEGKGHNVVIGTFIMIAVNVCGDIYAAVTNRGMFEIGLATSASYIAGCAFAMFCLSGKERAIKLSLRRIRISLLGSIFHGGINVGAIRGSHMLRTYALNVIMTLYLGKEALSAVSLQNVISVSLACIASGIGTAILTMGSVYYG